MTGKKTALFVKIGLTAALSLTLAFALAGCGKKSETVSTKGTAKTTLDAARSALSTMAPDAKLLVVQTATSTTPTATPIWAYLFGSSKDDKVYVVYVQNGKAMPASEYGTAGLSAAEWKQIPDTTDWKIDSNEAYKKALAASGAKGDPASYMMGFTTYVPKSSGSSIKAFVWNVVFEPGKSGATTATIDVNATTGATSIEK